MCVNIYIKIEVKHNKIESVMKAYKINLNECTKAIFSFMYIFYELIF